MKKIYLSAEDYKIISEIFKDQSFEVLVFGSRVKGNHQKFSDLDLCLKANTSIDLSEMNRFRVSLSESNLPFTVDLVDYSDINNSFKNIIDNEAIDFFRAKPIL